MNEADATPLLHHLQIWIAAHEFRGVDLIFISMQLPALIGTGFAAWWIHDYLSPLLEKHFATRAEQNQWRERLDTLTRMVFSLCWLVFLLIARGIAVELEWPHHMVRVMINLVTAWVVIRFFSLLLKDPLWARSIAILAYTIAALNILHWLGPLTDLLDSFAFHLGEVRISILNLIQWLIYFAVLLWIAMVLSEMLERRLSRVKNFSPSTQVLIGKVFKIAVIILAGIISLSAIGINLTALAVFSGALGVGIGFGLQRIASNLLSGFMLLMDKSIKPGDIIRIGGTYGWVSSMGARYVSVETRDGVEYLIPNEDIITQQVVNWSHKDDYARLKLPVRVSYLADVEQALALMLKAADNKKRVLEKPAPRALMIGFEDGFVDLELRIWICDVQNGIRNVSSDVLREVWRLFYEHKVPLPIPRRMVYLQSQDQITWQKAKDGLVDD